ncbi:MAG: hypothetical protein ACUVTX_12340 [Bacteroidales bacterium]
MEAKRFMSIRKKFRIINRFILREEDFGGLVFLTVKGEIFQVNHAAYEKLVQLLRDKEYFCDEIDELPFWNDLVSQDIAEEVE